MPARLAGLAVLLAAATCVAAPYKMVGPDGRITYTDRPPPGANAKPLGAASAAAEAGAASSADGLAANGVALSELPYDLRQVVQKFPVLLLAGENCVPCDLGRAALRQRGIPFGERSVKTRADVEALKRQESGSDLPVLRVGGQRLRGFSATEWNETLDLAGYPKTSVLSSRYRAPTPSPLVSSVSGGASEASAGGTGPAQSRGPAPAAVPVPTPAPESDDPAKPRIRF